MITTAQSSGDGQKCGREQLCVTGYRILVCTYENEAQRRKGWILLYEGDITTFFYVHLSYSMIENMYVCIHRQNRADSPQQGLVTMIPRSPLSSPQLIRTSSTPAHTKYILVQLGDLNLHESCGFQHCDLAL